MTCYMPHALPPPQARGRARHTVRVKIGPAPKPERPLLPAAVGLANTVSNSPNPPAFWVSNPGSPNADCTPRLQQEGY